MQSSGGTFVVSSVLRDERILKFLVYTGEMFTKKRCTKIPTGFLYRNGKEVFLEGIQWTPC